MKKAENISIAPAEEIKQTCYNNLNLWVKLFYLLLISFSNLQPLKLNFSLQSYSF